MAIQFRTKDIIVEAMQLAGTPSETMNVCNWVHSHGYPWLIGNATEPATLVPEGGGKAGDPGIWIDPGTGQFVIRTLSGDAFVTYGDWIIRDMQDEFHPIKSNLFALLLEKEA